MIISAELLARLQEREQYLASAKAEPDVTIQYMGCAGRADGSFRCSGGKS